MEKERKVQWGALILGLVFMWAALTAFRNPAGDLVAVVITFGITAIVAGVVNLMIRNKWKQITGSKSSMLMVMAIIDIIIGLVLLFNIGASVTVLPFVFAIWFIVDSIRGLLMLDTVKVISKGYYWFSLIVNILGIVVGFMLFFDPITSALTLAFLVGFYFLMASITCFVEAFTA